MGESYVRYILETALSAGSDMVVAELPAGTRFPESGIVTTRPTRMWIGTAEAAASHSSCMTTSFLSRLTDAIEADPATVIEQADRLARLLRSLLNSGTARTRAVLCYEVTARFSGTRRRTISASMGPPAEGSSQYFDLDADEDIFLEDFNDAGTTAAIRSTPLWAISPHPHFTLVRTQGSAISSGRSNQLTEFREFFGFLNLRDSEQRYLASIGIFPVQYGGLSRDQAAGSYVLNEPFFTFVMFSDEAELINVRAQAYTIHVDPQSVRVSSVLSYITIAAQRFGVHPDLIYGIEHHRQEGRILP